MVPLGYGMQTLIAWKTPCKIYAGSCCTASLTNWNWVFRNYGMERVWCMACVPGSNDMAFGYDEGTISIKVLTLVYPLPFLISFPFYRQ